jgi:hypothetical protein
MAIRIPAYVSMAEAAISSCGWTFPVYVCLPSTKHLLHGASVETTVGPDMVPICVYRSEITYLRMVIPLPTVCTSSLRKGVQVKTTEL